MNELMNE